MNPNKSDQNKMVLSPSESYLPYQGDRETVSLKFNKVWCSPMYSSQPFVMHQYLESLFCAGFSLALPQGRNVVSQVWEDSPTPVQAPH